MIRYESLCLKMNDRLTRNGLQVVADEVILFRRSPAYHIDPGVGTPRCVYRRVSEWGGLEDREEAGGGEVVLHTQVKDEGERGQVGDGDLRDRMDGESEGADRLVGNALAEPASQHSSVIFVLLYHSVE